MLYLNLLHYTQHLLTDTQRYIDILICQHSICSTDTHIEPLCIVIHQCYFHLYLRTDDSLTLKGSLKMNDLYSSSKTIFCFDIMSDQSQIYLDNHQFWSEDVRWLTIISSTGNHKCLLIDLATKPSSLNLTLYYNTV